MREAMKSLGERCETGPEDFTTDQPLSHRSDSPTKSCNLCERGCEILAQICEINRHDHDL